MKALLLQVIGLALGLLNISYAQQVSCEQQRYHPRPIGRANRGPMALRCGGELGHWVVAGGGEMYCEDNEGYDYCVDIYGVGLGLQSAEEGVWVSCSGDFFRGNYFGVRGNAAAVWGVDVATFVGENGICVLGGLQYGLGASVSGSMISVRR